MLGSQFSQIALPLVAIHRPRRERLRGRPPRRDRVPPVHPVRLPAGVWVDRLPPQADPRRRRPRTRAAARLDSARLLVRRADDLAPLRRRLRWSASAPSSSTSPTSRTSPRSSSATSWSRATRSSRSAARPRSSPGPGLAGVIVERADGAGRGPARRDQLPRLGALPLPDPEGGDAARAAEREAGPGMRPRPARDCGFVLRNRYLRCDRDLVPRRRTSSATSSCGHRRLRGARARHVAPAAIGLAFSLGTSAAARRAHHEQDLRPARRRPDDPLGAPGSTSASCCPSTRADANPSRSSSRRWRLGSASPIYNITQVSFRQAICPERIQGRMNAVIRFIVWGTMPLGSLLGGALGTWFGSAGRALGRRRSGAPRVPAGPPLAGAHAARDAGAGRRAAAVRGRGRGRAVAGGRGATAARTRLTAAQRYRSCHARATRGRGVGARARPARLALPDPAGRPRTHRDAEDLRPAAARARRATVRRRPPPRKWLLFPTKDGELQLRIHLMSAGRIRHLAAGKKGPKTPAFRLRFEDGGELILTEGGPKKRAGVWLETPEQTEAELAHIGPEALGLSADRLREILAGDNRRLHSLLRDQRALAGIGRAHANEILHRAQLSPFALSSKLERGGDRAARRGDRRGPDARARAARGRQGRQGRLSRPQPPRRALSALRRAAPAGRLRGAHGLLLRELSDRRPSAQGPADVASAQVAVR